MSLTNRLSAFALGGLALVLAGFSVALAVGAGVYLHRQTLGRADAALHALFAAVEVHPADVQWEPLERKITFGTGPSLDEVRWVLRDDAGRVVDRSPNLDGGMPADAAGSWTFDAWSVAAARFDPRPADPGDFDAAATVELPADRTTTATAFTIGVAVSHTPERATLWHLVGGLTLASCAVWAAAALGVRAFCRRALRPVAAMASAANAVGDDPAGRLPVAPSGDELEGLGRAFNGLLERLHAAYDRQRRFTGDAAHQLRTPLAAVLGQLEVALRHERPAEEYRRVLGVAHRRADHLRQIVESLLFLARAGTDQHLQLDALDVADWLRGRRDECESDDIVWDIPETPCVARVHAGLLGQAFANLLDNAVKYSAPGQTVRVELSAEGCRVELAVVDEGCGIAAEDRGRLGEPFFRAATARQNGTPGVGLGLAVVRRVAAVFAGQLSVTSEPGRGSRFALIVPSVPHCVETVSSVGGIES